VSGNVNLTAKGTIALNAGVLRYFCNTIHAF